MLLVVDIGNTNVTFGLYAQGAFMAAFRVETRRSSTGDEYAAFLHQSLCLHEFAPAAVSASVIASVVPPLTSVVSSAVQTVCKRLVREPLVVGPQTRTGITIVYPKPDEVGADRIVNAVAAFAKVRGGAIVVDFGTATTFDCISPAAEYLGGVIAPGLEVSLTALLGRAAKLQPVAIAVPPRVLGDSTAHAIQSGTLFGHAALADGLVGRLRGELGFPCRVIATGGFAQLLFPHTRSIDEVDTELTLDGLRLVHEKQFAHP